MNPFASHGLVALAALCVGIGSTGFYYHSHFDPASITQIQVYRLYDLGKQELGGTFFVQSVDAKMAVEKASRGYDGAYRVTFEAKACPIAHSVDHIYVTSPARKSWESC